MLILKPSTCTAVCIWKAINGRTVWMQWLVRVLPLIINNLFCLTPNNKSFCMWTSVLKSSQLFHQYNFNDHQRTSYGRKSWENIYKEANLFATILRIKTYTHHTCFSLSRFQCFNSFITCFFLSISSKKRSFSIVI